LKTLSQAPATAATLNLLREYESRNITFMEPDGSWPIVWDRARDVYVWDLEGKRYLDLTAAFGVAACGHANLRVVAAGRRQMGKLLHAMGDVHPHPLKSQLARELSRVTFERWSRGKKKQSGKTIFCNSGFEAVEAALKTAMLATGKSGVIAFRNAYHGLGYGSLNVTARAHFRGPFLSQLSEFGYFVEFPVEGKGDVRKADLRRVEQQVLKVLRRQKIGAILVEPIQVRGGINIPPTGFLALLRRICDQSGLVLILDEIYSGFGRTGKWFACEHSTIVPDIVCLGKALTGGFPLSACVGKKELMDQAWPASTGEAIHTSTFLGHPVGCAMALAQIQELRQWIAPSAKLGKWLLASLVKLESSHPTLKLNARGLGLLAGLELVHADGSPATKECLGIIKRLLHSGFVLLPEGEHGNVISFSPPLTIQRSHLERMLIALEQILRGGAV
jgi:4-aminobutyrate aminotransferase-like enzyme